jgi:chromosome partitioning protein
VIAAVLSLKGGVGKTSTVLGLAGAALGRGIPTLVVDLDPQANATAALTGSVPAPDDPGVSTVLDDPSTLPAAIRRSGWVEVDGLLDLVPGSPRTELFDDPDPTAGRLRRLRAALRAATAYSLVLLDCPPSLGRLARNALAAADRALIVTEPGLFGVHGADRALAAVREAQLEHPDLRPAGVLVNRYRERSPEHRFRERELRALVGELLLDPPVPDRTAIQRAQDYSSPLAEISAHGVPELLARYDQLLDQITRPMA